MQALRSRNAPGTHQGWGRRAWLLTGLLVCPCEHTLRGVAQPLPADVQGGRRTRYVYRCAANRRHSPGTCTGGASITAAVAERDIVDWLFAFFSSDRLEQYYARLGRSSDLAIRRVESDLTLADADVGSFEVVVPEPDRQRVARSVLESKTREQTHSVARVRSRRTRSCSPGHTCRSGSGRSHGRDTCRCR